MRLNLNEADDRNLPGDEEKVRERELQAYEDRYGKDATPEEEQEILLATLSKEARDIMEMASTAEAIYQHLPSIESMDDADRSLAVDLLIQRASEHPLPGVSLESMDRSDRNEGKFRTLLQWAGQAVMATYQILGYTLKRTGVYISRSKKNVDGLEQRLTKLDGLMKKRKSEDNRIFFPKNKLILLVDEYDVNTAPAGAVSSFISTIYSILDDYVNVLRTISTKADSDLSKGEGAEIDIDSYKSLISDMLSELDDKFKSKELLIGNRYVKVDKNAKPSKAISLAVGRPDPKSIIGKFRPMAALSNSAVESQRSTLRSSVIKKMYKVLDDTAEDMEKISKAPGLSAKKGKDKADATPDKKDVATLSKFLTETSKELIEGIVVLSDMVYETVDASVSLLEDSVSVTQIHGTTDGREAARFLS